MTCFLARYDQAIKQKACIESAPAKWSSRGMDEAGKSRDVRERGSIYLGKNLATNTPPPPARRARAIAARSTVTHNRAGQRRAPAGAPRGQLPARASCTAKPHSA